MTNASDSAAKAIARMLETQRAINGLARQLELLSSTTRMLSPLSLEADRVLGEATRTLSAYDVTKTFRALEDQGRADLRALALSTITLPRLDATAIFGPASLISEQYDQLQAMLTSFHTNLFAQHAAVLAEINAWAPRLAGAMANTFRMEALERSILRWTADAELSARGWWLVPSWDDAFIRRLLREMHTHRGQRVVVTALRVHYEARGCRALAAMVRDWTLPELTRRRAMLRDAVALYRRHRYAAAVKVLTGFEEAVVNETLIRKGYIQHDSRKPQILFTQHVGRGRSGAASFESAFTALFASFAPGSSWMGREPKRHRIAHGSPLQNRAASALRMFLILDTLEHYLTRLK